MLQSRNLVIDTQYFLRNKLDFDNAELKSLANLVNMGNVYVYLTDITNMEIEKKIKDEVNNAYAKIETSDAGVLKQIPLFRQFISTYDRIRSVGFFIEKFNEFKKKCNVEIISSDTVKVKDIFSSYCGQQPPFNDKVNKKTEFPDAFALAAINEWGKRTKGRAYLLSGDSDWALFAAKSDTDLFGEERNLRFISINVLSEFTDAILRNEDALKDEVAFADSIFERKENEILNHLIKKLQITGFWCEGDTNGEIIEVYFLDAKVLSKDIVSVSREGVVYDLDVKVDGIFRFSLPDYDSAPYDLDSKKYVVHEYHDIYTHQTVEVNIEVELSYEEGLEVNFEIATSKIPDLIGIEYEDECAIDVDEWIKQRPVIVCGVENGKVTDNGLGVMRFENFMEAQKLFPGLDIYRASTLFSAAMGNKINEDLRFETETAMIHYSS